MQVVMLTLLTGGTVWFGRGKAMALPVVKRVVQTCIPKVHPRKHITDVLNKALD